MSEPSQDQPSATAAPDAELLAALADDFSSRLRRREHPTVEEYVARHPALGERIRNVLAAVALIEQSRADAALPAEGPGATVGRYRLLERIGEGGFGVVYMAEQLTPVRRKVALKVIKPGMDSCQVLARFEAERQALAIMDHPNVATVLDAGATESGRPYFVMELVKGEPITDYCDRNRLEPRQRLELFVQVCHAVQHAHQKGIIHRDLKPSNLLVATHDTNPVVKVIDFGVAKALGPGPTEHTLFTGFAQLLGTPLYMSPEQAGRSSLDVDTRSDIYSLGVLLYELLTGTTPFDKERFRQAAHDEIRRIIREEEPPKPSTRLSASRDSLASISARRQTEPARLTKLVRGELDWIVMKSLEKDRARRYQTANGLTADVLRHLHDEPVLACPPSAAYRLRKFVRRHKGPVLAAALVLLALAAGVIGTTWGLVRADRARHRAEAREAETKAAVGFLQERIFAAARPQGMEGGLGPDVSLREAIETATPFVETTFRDQPLIRARLQMTIGVSYVMLGEYAVAENLLRKAWANYLEHRGPDDPDTLWAAHFLGECRLGLGHTDEALELVQETLARRKARLGPDHPDTLWSMHLLASCYGLLGRNAQSLKLTQETLALRRAKLGLDHRDTLTTMGNLAVEYYKQGRYDDALKLNEETLALRKARHGPDHPYTLWSMQNIARDYRALGRHADAVKLDEQTLALRRAKLGPTHPHTLRSMQFLAESYGGAGRHDDAAKLHEEALALRKAKLGTDHPETLEGVRALAETYARLRRFTDVLKLSQETLTISRIKYGPTDPRTLDHAIPVALLLTRSNDLQGPEAMEAVELARQLLEVNPNDSEAWHILGAALYRAGDWKSAVDAMQKSVNLRKGGNPSLYLHFAMADWQLGRREEARARYGRIVDWMNKNEPANDDSTPLLIEAATLLGLDPMNPQVPSTAPATSKPQVPEN